MADRPKVQAYLSDRSMERVNQIRETFKKLGDEISESKAVNILIEREIKLNEEMGEVK